jgi:hypothetical protein
VPSPAPHSLAGFLPWRIVRDSGAPQIEWIFGDGARFTEPFLDDTLARLRFAHPAANTRAARPRTPLDALRAMPPGAPLAGLIFHVSRCGSTLVAQMLAALPHHIVASEPPILDDLLRTAALDTKNPGQPFAPDAAAKRASVPPTLAAACACWATPHHAVWLRALAADSCVPVTAGLA